MGPMYIETPCMYTNIEWAEIIGQLHGSYVYSDTLYFQLLMMWFDVDHYDDMKTKKVASIN